MFVSVPSGFLRTMRSATALWECRPKRVRSFTDRPGVRVMRTGALKRFLSVRAPTREPRSCDTRRPWESR